MDVETLRKTLQKYDQEHLLAFWDQLDQSQQGQLYKELSDLDLDYVTESFERCVADLNEKTEKLDDKMEPLPSEHK